VPEIADRLANLLGRDAPGHSLADGAEARVTISIGVSEAAAEMECSADMMKRADQALYGAKEGGKAQVAAAGGPA